MTQFDFGKAAPTRVPGATLTPEDLARVTSEDWAQIQKLARGYCRTVDATRSRKRMDGSATIVKGGYAPYGTDDISDDVTQDAILLFAQRLRNVLSTCETASDGDGWIYIRRDGAEMTITRLTLQRWAVRDAAARNGYRIDVPPEEMDATPGAQLIRGLPHMEHVARVAVAFSVAQHSAEIFRQAFGEGEEFPTLRRILRKAEAAEDLGRAGILATVAQEQHGGAYGSRRAVIRVRDAARAELRELSERLDDARNAMVCTGTETSMSD
ncbi:hypothetical protein OHA25_08255 [Nonomuraea sp. NBC_00507]|uniref:hypothetical protein n=1 Tax=Nonomuraea sp. NBC_00507 TaxID=2976002 RepID=UPI002E17FA4D